MIDFKRSRRKCSKSLVHAATGSEVFMKRSFGKFSLLNVWDTHFSRSYVSSTKIIQTIEEYEKFTNE